MVIVASGLLEKLSDAERLELRDTLKGNEPQPDFWLSNLDAYIQHAADEVRGCVDRSNGEDVSKRKLLEAKLKSIDEAWLHFFKTAQNNGLKRRSPRQPKAQVPMVPEQSKMVSEPGGMLGTDS